MIKIKLIRVLIPDDSSIYDSKVVVPTEDVKSLQTFYFSFSVGNENLFLIDWNTNKCMFALMWKCSSWGPKGS